MNITLKVIVILLACAFTYFFGGMIAPLMFAHGSSAAFDFGVFIWIVIVYLWVHISIWCGK